MRLVHSYITDNAQSERFKQNVFCAALSVLYAKNNGFAIDLYCDSESYDAFRHIPYDNIYPVLDKSVFPPLCKGIYAASKFMALPYLNLGDIHIDFDVFLIGKNIKDMLNFDGYDCIVQSKELYKYAHKDNWKWSMRCFDNVEFPAWSDRRCARMYNCGVVGFNNEELKQEYLSAYQLTLKRYLEDGFKYEGGVPDIIIEQKFLADLCENKGANVKFLLPEDDFIEVAHSIGYSHLVGDAKLKHRHTIHKLIKRKDEELYKLLNIKLYGRVFR